MNIPRDYNYCFIQCFLIYNILRPFFMHLFPPYNDIKETHKFRQMYINMYIDKNKKTTRYSVLLCLSLCYIHFKEIGYILLSFSLLFRI